MGENIKMVEQRSSADELREQIRHTEGDITETVETLEYRLSPGYLGRQGVRKAKMAAWQGTAKLLALAQKRSVQVSVVGATALLMLLGTRKTQQKGGRQAFTEAETTGKALKALGASAFWMLVRKRLAQKRVHRGKAALPAMSMAAVAAKSFLGGARRNKKHGTAEPGKKDAWRGLASTIGAALGSYWYSHRGHRV